MLILNKAGVYEKGFEKWKWEHVRNAFMILKKQSWQFSHQDISFNIYMFLNALLIYFLSAIQDKYPKFWKRKGAVALEEMTVIMSYISVTMPQPYSHGNQSVFHLTCSWKIPCTIVQVSPGVHPESQGIPMLPCTLSYGDSFKGMAQPLHLSYLFRFLYHACWHAGWVLLCPSEMPFYLWVLNSAIFHMQPTPFISGMT